MVTCAEKKKNGTLVVLLIAHAVAGMFYSLVANQRQSQYTQITLHSVGANRSQLLHIYIVRGMGEGGEGPHFTPPSPAGGGGSSYHA